MQPSVVDRTFAQPATLAASLRARIRGDVRFDHGNRALYATDASNCRQTPIGVVPPKSVDDLVAAVPVARGHGAPITSRRCGTSLAGQCCNTSLIFDMPRHLNRVPEIDAPKPLARVPQLRRTSLLHDHRRHKSVLRMAEARCADRRPYGLRPLEIELLGAAAALLAVGSAKALRQGQGSRA